MAREQDTSDQETNDCFCVRTHRSILVVFAAIILPALLSLLFLEKNSREMDAWLPSGSETRREYDRFLNIFGNDDFVLVSWEDCRIDHPSLQAFKAAIRGDSSLVDTGLIGQAVFADEILELLKAEPSSISDRSARKRLRGVFLGLDLEQTCVVIYLTDKGSKFRDLAIEQVRVAAIGATGLDRDEIRLNGNAYLSVMVDVETNRSLIYAVPAGLVALVVAFCCLQSLRLVSISFLTAGIASLFSLAFVSLSGQPLNGLLVLMPALALVLTMSGGIHLLNYYRGARVSLSNREAIRYALDHGRRPCILATLTTSIGLASLAVSSIKAVFVFGMLSAISLLFALFLLLFFLPAMLAFWEPRTRNRTASAELLSNQTGSIGRFGAWKSSLGVIVLMFVLGVTSFGLTKTETQLELDRFFMPKHEVTENLQWYSQKLFPIDCLSVVIGCQKSDDASESTDQLLAVRSIQNRLSRIDSSRATFSVHNMIPVIPTGRSFASTLKRTTLVTHVNDSQADLQSAGLQANRGERVYWKIHLGLKSNETYDYQVVQDQVRSIAVETLAELDYEQDDFEVLVTGICPVFSQAQSTLFNDLATSFVLAFLFICPIMMVIVRSFIGGIVAMIPNFFPVVLIFGLMGWFGFALDVGTILTASVGLGIAVDDTLHFLEWYRCAPAVEGDEESEQVRRWNAVVYAWKKCATPMLQTTLICGLGLAVFAFSQFIPVKQFSVVIALILGSALIADLILLPLLIVSPLGRVFKHSQWK